MGDDRHQLCDLRVVLCDQPPATYQNHRQTLLSFWKVWLFFHFCNALVIDLSIDMDDAALATAVSELDKEIYNI